MLLNMKRIKVMSVFGTRPEAIKMAPLVMELSRRESIESICCLPVSTGKCWML